MKVLALEHFVLYGYLRPCIDTACSSTQVTFDARLRTKMCMTSKTNADTDIIDLCDQTISVHVIIGSMSAHSGTFNHGLLVNDAHQNLTNNSADFDLAAND